MCPSKSCKDLVGFGRTYLPNVKRQMDKKVVLFVHFCIPKCQLTLRAAADQGKVNMEKGARLLPKKMANDRVV